MSCREQLHLGNHDGQVTSIALSPNGKLLASGGTDKKVKLWNVATGQLMSMLSGHTAAVFSVAFSPNGQILASGSGEFESGLTSIEKLMRQPIKDGIKLWDVETGREILTLDETINGADTSGVDSLAFSPNGQILASTSLMRVKFWDSVSGKRLNDLAGYTRMISSMAIHPGGRLVVASLLRGDSDESIKLWNLETGGLSDTIINEKASWVTAFSPDGRMMVSGRGDNAIRFWDIATGRNLHTLEEKSYMIHSLTFNSDGKIMASSAGILKNQSASLRSTNTNTITLWDVEAMRELRVLKGHADFVRSVAFSPNDRFLASGGWDNLVKLWDVGTGQEIRTLTGHTRQVQAVSFNPQGDILASGSDDGTVRLWQVATGRVLRTLSGYNSNVFSIAFAPDGRTLVGGFGNGTIILWDTMTGQVIHKLEGHAFAVSSVKYGVGAGLLLSSGYDGTVKLWNTESGAELCSIIVFGEKDWVVVTPDGRFDTNNLDDIYALHWVMPDSPFTALPLEIFMRDYYEPRLLPKLLAREQLKPVRELKSLNRTQPQVSNLQVSTLDSQGRVSITLEAASQKSAAQRDRNGMPLTSGVEDVRLFRNGQLVGYCDGQLVGARTPIDKAGCSGEVKTDATGKATITFRNIKLPRRADLKQVEFSAYAFNTDRVKSETARKTYELPQPLPTAKGRAYIITVGVNAYDDPTIKPLRYAASDAELMPQRLVAELKRRGEYTEVVEVKLTSDYQVRLGNRLIPSREATKDELNSGLKNGTLKITERSATKSNIKAVFDLLAGHPVAAADVARIPNGGKLRAARPEDLIVIAFSSHGYASPDGVFYLLPADIKQKNSLSQAISSSELELWLRDVDGGEMVMIVDACHSAASVGNEFKPGPMGSRGLGQLAYDKGMKILAATQADNVAWESGKGKQGLLTYALVRDGLEQGNADFKPQDGTINLTEWLEYGAARVPKLYDCVQNLKAGCGLVIEGRDLAQEAGQPQSVSRDAWQTQKPALFDFARKRREVILVGK